MEDRVEDRKKFAEHMEAYIRDRTVEKYGVKIRMSQVVLTSYPLPGIP